MAQNKEVIGEVTEAGYNSTEKAIRFVLKVEGGHMVQVEWPITMFRFTPGMDKDEEMKKTAKLLHGKRLRMVSTAEEADG